MSETKKPCESRPFMRLQEDYSNAPILNYNMEQENCLNLYSIVPVPFSKDFFIPQSYENPSDAFWDKISTMNKDEIRHLLLNDLVGGNSNFFDNFSEITRASVPVIFSIMYIKKVSEDLYGTTPAGNAYLSKSGRLCMPVVIHGNKSNMHTGDISFPLKALSGEGEPVIFGWNPDFVTSMPGIYFTPNNAVELDIDYLVDQFSQRKKAFVIKKMDGGIELKFSSVDDIEPSPLLYLSYELMMCSYLGNYGAGKTVSTFSLLPGEKTTITMRSYTESRINRSKAENVLDSMSDSSSNNFENSLQQQNGKQTDFSSNVGVSTSFTHTQKTGAMIDLFVAKNQGVSGVNTSVNSSFHTNSISTNVSNALSQHVNESNKFRQVNVNVSTNEDFTSGEETTIVRELENINLSRTLNFVFRQLLQEHITVLWVKNIKFGFSNGDPSSFFEVPSYQLRPFLEGVVKPERVTEVWKKMMQQAMYVFNYDEQPIPFFECRNLQTPTTDCECTPNNSIDGFSDCLWIRTKGLKDTVGNITVPGVILNVERHTLQTPSVIVDALLGQGEALDCYNTHLQQESVIAQELKNEQVRQAVGIIDAFNTPEDKAKFYKQVFGDCCNDKNFKLDLGTVGLNLNANVSSTDNSTP